VALGPSRSTTGRSLVDAGADSTIVVGSGGLSLTGGHHRTAEIARRAATGELPPATPVSSLLHDLT
jgi:hypothetical protein